MMLGSRILGLSAFAGSSFLSVLRVSAALGCVGVFGSRFIKALIKAGGVVPCLGMADPG